MNNASILVVDDEKNIRLMLTQCLENTGYRVTAAVDGEHALEKFKNDQYDLILLDMKLPGIDGLEVLRQVKQKRREQTVVMITAHGTIETAVEAMKVGAVDYLQKPFTPEEIRAIVQKVLERKNLASPSPETSFENNLEQAKLAITQQNFDQAMSLLHQIVGLAPDKPEAFNLLGAIYEIKGNLDQAVKMYRAAQAIDPSYQPANSNLHRATQWSYSREEIDLGEEK